MVDGVASDCCDVVAADHAVVVEALTRADGYLSADPALGACDRGDGYPDQEVEPGLPGEDQCRRGVSSVTAAMLRINPTKVAVGRRCPRGRGRRIRRVGRALPASFPHRGSAALAADTRFLVARRPSGFRTPGVDLGVERMQLVLGEAYGDLLGYAIMVADPSTSWYALARLRLGGASHCGALRVTRTVRREALSLLPGRRLERPAWSRRALRVLRRRIHPASAQDRLEGRRACTRGRPVRS